MLVSKFDAHVDLRAQAYDPYVDGIPYSVYGALGLTGEAGEVADKIKKLYRNKHGEANAEDLAQILDELGDTLWYLTYIAHSFGYTLADVMNRNVIKLADRAKRGVTIGSGDNR